MWMDPILACAPAVHPVTMAQVVRVESAGNPLAVNVNELPADQQPRPRTTDEAVAAAKLWISRGYRVDLGLGQISDRNLPALGYTIEQVLSTDPAVTCANLTGSARILAEAYGRAVRILGEGQPALMAALSAYNTGTFTGGFANGYLARYVPEIRPSMASRVETVSTKPVSRHRSHMEVW